MSETVRSRPPEQLSPYEAVLRSFGYFERATIEELAAARSGLESAVQKGAGLCRGLGHAFDPVHSRNTDKHSIFSRIP